ncbi:hypothetical protein Tco_0736986, partial [Tanacetum coccineum]
CQVIDKFKKGIGYDAATAASPVVEGFVDLTDKSGSDKAYHAVPPLLTGNFIPRKPDLRRVVLAACSMCTSLVARMTPAAKAVAIKNLESAKFIHSCQKDGRNCHKLENESSNFILACFNHL